MLLTRLSAHLEHPGPGQLRTYPAVLHNPRAKEQASTWAWSKQAMIVLQGRKKVIFIEANCIEQ